ncbi:MAG: 5-dehydro-2-deoxygluconokinase [Anaerovoracaceae bacterium]
MISKNSNKDLDVICIGRAGIDLHAGEINRPMEETMTFIKNVGGSPANIAVGSNQLGLKVGFIGKVSDDQHGRFIFNEFARRGINTEGVVTDKEGKKSGLAFTEVKSPTDCGILMYRDDVADLNLAIEDIDEDYIKRAKILMVSGTALAQSPSREAVFLAVEYAGKNDTAVFFDIDYRPYTWKSEEETGIYYALMAEKSNVIIGTREEFDTVEKLRIPKEQNSEKTEDEKKEDEKTAEEWLSHSAEIVFIKHGKEGGKVYRKSGEIVEAAVYPVVPVKTMGAGDAFASGLLYGFINEIGIYEATKVGAAAAAIVVSENSCAEAMPTIEEVNNFIRNY